MIFLTVGTQFGFDRLVKAVDLCVGSGVVDDDVLAQIGPGKYVPKHMKSLRTLERAEFDRVVGSADAIISHAGIGSISLAMKSAKPLLVMPRRKAFGEVVNDHQVATAHRFSQLNCLLVANDSNDLAQKLLVLKRFTPTPRHPNRKGLIDRISLCIRAGSDDDFAIL